MNGTFTTPSGGPECDLRVTLVTMAVCNERLNYHFMTAQQPRKHSYSPAALGSITSSYTGHFSLDSHAEQYRHDKNSHSVVAY